MTNHEIISNNPDLYVHNIMDLARKDEAVAFGEWMDSEGRFYSRSQSIGELYLIFKQQNEKQ